jgi:hypothetical protein
MFAYRPPEQVKPHTPEELAREELACLTPAFQGILGDPAIEQRNKQAMATAIATPNRGLDGDIPANGTEQGYVAAKFPVIGTRAGRAIPGGTETYLPVSRDDAPFPAPLIAPRDLTNIHTPQSPRRALGLSAADIIDTEPPPRGLGMNIVVLDRDGKRYCRLARQ